MNKSKTIGLSFFMLAIFALTAMSAAGTSSAKAKGFVHGIVFEVDGVDYYMVGAPDGPNGEFDVPGHYWVQAGPNQLVGKHYNTGPFGMPQWWSSDAADGELLYIVHGIIDTWSMEKAEAYASRGYVHRHEMRAVEGGAEHPNKVIWLRHTAITTFIFDGGPMPGMAQHYVTPGVDYAFPNNYMMPYGV